MSRTPLKSHLKTHLFYLLSATLLATACAPRTQTTALSEVIEVQPASESQFNAQLLGNTLNVPGTERTIALDTPFLQGELAPFEVGADKGTVRLLSQGMRVRQGEREFLVLPVEVLRVSGAGGLYLMLLEQTGATFTQRDAQSLGKRVSLLGLELEDNLITATTVDSHLGKAPDFEVSRGGVKRFELREGKLEEVSS